MKKSYSYYGYKVTIVGELGLEPRNFVSHAINKSVVSITDDTRICTMCIPISPLPRKFVHLLLVKVSVCAYRH